MSSPHLTGIVTQTNAGFIGVLVDEPEVDAQAVITCKLRGRLKHQALKTDLCVIGDRVVVERGQVPVVIEVLPRRNVFSRAHPSNPRREDVLIANLDQLMVVFAYNNPPLHARMIDRFLVIAEHARLRPVLVANKCDQKDDERSEIFRRYQLLGYPVIEVSSVTLTGLDAVKEALRGNLTAVVGPSGSGKSTLLNTISPDLKLRTGDTSDSTSKGRHTTRLATLHRFENGFVADTPGLRELAAWNLPKEEMANCFPEFRPYFGHCGFRNCSHRSEPGCELRAALERHEVSAERYESYLRLYNGDER